MPQLLPPDVHFRESWVASQREWGVGAHQDGTGLRPGEDPPEPVAFEELVQRLTVASDLSVPPGQGRVHGAHWWVVEGDEYQGASALRYELNDFLLRAGGHIGYGIRPLGRRRGLASWALGQVLVRAREHGLDRALITGDETNAGSRRTIKGAGGELEDVRETELGLTRRYWVDLTD